MGKKEVTAIPTVVINDRKRVVSFSDAEAVAEKQPLREEDSADEPAYTLRQSFVHDDDEESVLSLPAELPPPPDGGWGWVIVVASFVGNFIVDGISYSFSPFLPVYSDYFQEPQGKVAWVPSLLAGVYLSVGPIVSSLTNRFGCRRVCIAGGLVSGLAYASTIFANRIEYLMVTQGFIAGVGFGMIYLPAVVTVGYYFESKRALATGIAVCGSGAGTMVFPVILNALIDEYGWQGANLIVAGIILNVCWLGGLMRPLKVAKMRKKDFLNRLADEKRSIVNPSAGDFPHNKSMNVDPGVNSHLNLSGYMTPIGGTAAAGLPTIQEGGPQPSSPEQKKPTVDLQKGSSVDPHNEVLKNMIGRHSIAVSSSKGPLLRPADEMPRNLSQPSMEFSIKNLNKILSVPNFERRPSRLDAVGHLKLIPATPDASYTNLRSLHNSQDIRRLSSCRGTSADVDPEALALRRRSSKDSTMLRPMSRQDIFYSGSIRHLDEFKSQASFLSYRESTVNIHGIGASKAVLELALDAVEASSEDSKIRNGCCPESLLGTMAQMMDFSLLKNPVFLTIGIANLLGMLGFYTPFVYLPAAAMEKGIDKASATFLVSIIGITNTVGRVLSGLLADLHCVNALWVNNICILMSATCVFLTPFATTYTSFVCIAVFFGFFVSGYIALSSVILVSLIGLENLTNAFGLLILFRGSGSMVGSPVAGSIYDATQSYDVSFWSAGALLFTCAGLHFLVPCIQRLSCYEEPIRYTTNEAYLAAEEDRREGDLSPEPPGDTMAGIVLDIKPSSGSQPPFSRQSSVASAGIEKVDV